MFNFRVYLFVVLIFGAFSGAFFICSDFCKLKERQPVVVMRETLKRGFSLVCNESNQKKVDRDMKLTAAGLSIAASLFVGICVLPATGAQADDVKAIKTVAPEYPRGAERRKIEGYVVLEYTISASGDVQDVKVVESTPEGIFEDAAAEAVAQWKFEKTGSPVTNKQTKISFKL